MGLNRMSDLHEAPAEPAQNTRCDLDATAPHDNRCAWITWCIGFAEISGLVLFLSVLIFVVVKFLFRF
jgi:hypothetical protein